MKTSGKIFIYALSFINHHIKATAAQLVFARFKGRAVVATMALSSFLATMAHATSIAAWDLTGSNTVATATTTASDAHLTSAPVLTRGSSAAASTGANSFRTVGFKNDGISTTNNDYFQATFTAASGYTLSLNTIDATFAGTSTFVASPGVTSQFAYSLDGSTFTLIGSPVQSTSLTMAQVSLTGISDLQNVPAGTTVYIRYYASGQTATGGWGFNSPSAGSFGLNIGGVVAIIPTGTPPGNLVVTPSSITTNLNATVTFTVSATGDAPSYFWYQEVGGTTNLVSTDGSTLTLANVTTANSGNYQVVLTNASGAATSSVVTLTVNDPAIIVQPANMTNVLNDVDFFTAAAVSTQPMDLYWFYNGTVISNLSVGAIATTNTIFVANTPAATNLPGYFLVASNQFGMVTSVVATATIFVTPSVEITRWDFNAPDTYTPTNPTASIGTGLATPGPNPGVTNFIFANGALFDPNQLVDGSVNDAMELNGFPAGITNKTAGFQYNTSTAGFKNILLTWSERHSATASKYMRVQYTTNGMDFIDGDVEAFSAVEYQFYSSNLGTNPGVANNPNFAFRVVAEWESSAIGTVNSNYDGTSGAFGSGGTIREDLMTMWGDPLSLVVPIPLHIKMAGTNVVLTWNDESSAFSLQSAPLVNGTYNTVSGATSPYTNAITGAQQFFRLKSN